MTRRKVDETFLTTTLSMQTTITTVISYNVDDTCLYFTYKYTHTESSACLQIDRYFIFIRKRREEHMYTHIYTLNNISCTYTVNDI